jgi:hypothetical protein
MPILLSYSAAADTNQHIVDDFGPRPQLLVGTNEILTLYKSIDVFF